jgi:hypothetical protein
MSLPNCVLVDQQDQPLVQLDIHSIEDGWYYGWGRGTAIPAQIQHDLDWYDTVVSGQMLSYLDDAEAAVESHQLLLRLPDTTHHRVYSLHLAKSGEVSFRITPIEPAIPLQNEVASTFA